MVGTKEGRLKARDTIIERHGLDFYRNIGSKGGSAVTNKRKGFAAMSPEERRAANAKSQAARAANKLKK